MPVVHTRGTRPTPAHVLALVAAAVVSACPPAAASDFVTNTTAGPELSADAKGDVAVSWLQNGARTEFVIPPTGEGYHGPLPGTDVSRPASTQGLPFAPVVRSTPQGWLVALQTWSVAGQPPALHVSRWKGAPTTLTLSATATKLTGTATFQGKPVTGYTFTPSGIRQRIYVYIDCFGCPGDANGWSAMLGVAPKANGSFGVRLRPSWDGSHYRASLAGPNVGDTLAPDAQAFAAAA